MKRVFIFVLLVSVALGLIVVGQARPGHASFVSQYCNTTQYTDYHVRRKDAQPYAVVAEHEGYEGGGGCWDNNNRDDTPWQPDSNGEGPDCSGLVFKTWELQNNGGSGWTYHDLLQNDHGPYSSYNYHSPLSTNPFYRVSKSRSVMQYMDAFAKNGHVALLSSTPPPNGNTDVVIEAYTDTSGVGANVRTYRYDSAYSGVRRKGWTPDCWPNCGSPEDVIVIVR